MAHQLHVSTDEQAKELLSRTAFLEEWRSLFKSCEWSTNFQSPDFVISWFEVYQQYSPVIIYERAVQSKLCGLLLLAKGAGGEIVFAGTHHAEYKAWLEDKKNCYDFFPRALAEVTSCFGEFYLDFSYIRDKRLADILLTSCSGLVEVYPVPRDFKALTKDSILPSLKKKGNKSKINRLAKLGEVEYLRVSSAKMFRRYLQDCVIYHDIWQGAMNDCYPFYDDACKIDFHVRLFELSPKQLHVTVMLLSQKPIALHIGYVHGCEVLYSIIAHNPLYHKYSLGKLLLLNVAKNMFEEGFESFDLSPGGDSWKRDFSSGQSEAYIAFIHKNTKQKTLSMYQRQSKSWLKTIASKVGVDLMRYVTLFRKLARASRSTWSKRITSLLMQKAEFRIYRLRKVKYFDCFNSRFEFKRDNLNDLLQFKGVDGRSSRQQFLADALKRLGNGEHVYTYVDKGSLLCYGWLVDRQKKAHFSEVNQQYSYDVEGSVIYDFYVTDAARGQGLYTDIARRMLYDIFSADNSGVVYVSWLSSNPASPRLFENKLGFEFVESLFYKRILWFRRQWKSREFKA